MPLGPDQEPSAEMSRVLIREIGAAKPSLSLQEIMRVVAEAEWDFSSDPARVTFRIDEEPHVAEVSIVAAPKH